VHVRGVAHDEEPAFAIVARESVMDAEA